MKIISIALALSVALSADAYAKDASTVRIVAAGDIACDVAHREFGNLRDPKARCHSTETAALIAALHPDAVLPLGDLQYFGEDLQTFQAAYGTSWGAFKSVSHPVAGNHEYLVPGARGYFDYWGTLAGPRGKGWYSWNLGAWHFIALNGNCHEGTVGGCDSKSEQLRWLAADLKAHPRGCRLAYWHQPRFSSGPHGNDSDYADFWNVLYAAHADVVLNGHDHNYERFTAMNPQERADKRGIVEFVAGTGGRNHTRFFYPPHAESIVRNDGTFGILLMTLRRAGYSWEFMSEAGASFHDRGSAACHSSL